MPEVEETAIDIDEDRDLRIEVKRSSGPGGQSVNTTDSAVRITHLPTGLVVEIQDEKSQHKNKAKAMAVLRARLLELEQRKAHEEEAAARRGMVGSGERSEKIRTYNFPQSRITDHRINFTTHQLTNVMNGDLVELLFYPREIDLRVGETLTLQERDTGRSVIAQVIAFRSASVGGKGMEGLL